MTQTEYLNILFTDLGFDGKAKKALLQADYKKNFVDELSKEQASFLIDRLKKQKTDRKERTTPVRVAPLSGCGPNGPSYLPADQRKR